MKPLLQQETEYRWPNGIDKAAAILSAEPPELSERHGMNFIADVDSLGSYLAAALRLPSGRLVVLSRHQGDPGTGTSVYVDLLDDADAARRELTQLLGLTDHDFRWMRPIDETGVNG